jgi:hypothetical protein
VPGHPGDYPRREQPQQNDNYQEGRIDLPAAFQRTLPRKP